MINDFEKLLAQNGTHILKFYLHISPEEQLERFKRRLDDEWRHWKISENDYLERELWPPMSSEAYEDVPAHDQARTGRPGTSFRRTINGFATWRSRRSSPRPCKKSD